MTSEEAREWLRSIKDNYIHGGDEAFDNARNEALDMAIKALEQEPRKDEVILTNEEYRELVSNEFENGYSKGYREALEQEPREITLEDVKEYCKPRCLTIITDELLYELTHTKIKARQKVRDIK